VTSEAVVVVVAAAVELDVVLLMQADAGVPLASHIVVVVVV